MTPMRPSCPDRFRRHQRGTVLVISLIMLTVLSMLAFSAVRSTTAEERIAGDLRNSNVAFQAAETALRYCEGEVSRYIATRTADVPVHAFTGNSAAIPPSAWKLSANWAEDNTGMSRTVPAAMKLPHVSRQPECMIEEWIFALRNTLDGSEPFISYQVTARGYGGSADAIVLLQSSVRPPSL